MESIKLDSIQDAIHDIRHGKAVVVVDDEERENEGDLIFAAQLATNELMGFMVRHTSGVICVPMMGDWLDRLNIPMMTHTNEETHKTAYTVSVD
ncbi:MAG: 3,4-dihydroxy-2-butanone-4-phosphate synthase, partial [Candidatus Nanopelagicales bacterium]